MAAAAALLALMQLGPALPESLSSRHYDLKTSATRELGQELLDFMELVHSTYMNLLKPENPGEVEKRRFTLLLYKDQREYVQAGAPPGSGAYYNGRELVGWYDDTFMRPFFAHEGMHQFTDATSKNFRTLPMWFTEGIADCIGNCEVNIRCWAMLGAGGCSATVYLDGRRMNSLAQASLGEVTPKTVVYVDELVSPMSIAGVEVYPRGVRAPPEYQSLGGSCAIVLIWTR